MPIHGIRGLSTARRENPAANARPIAYNEDEAHPPRRRYALREFSMTDHTTPTPEPPADPNRDPEGDPLSPPSPGHHHDNPQQPDGPPSKDPV
ncbi:hypothetical protein B7G54_07525 [Burkholderia puraquae]|uniref:Uncharacterized protein n=1 Tax=Burkholderia puraquae TaxID=1904757 RepID=A0A1X1PKN7_9BURK|nr:hypothetical protein B7G54_07525 [Burkholderia puraquae]